MGKGILVRRRAEHDARAAQVTYMWKAFDRLIAAGQTKDGSTPFLVCDTIGQSGLYKVEEILRDVLQDMAEALGSSAKERLMQAFPYVWGKGTAKPRT